MKNRILFVDDEPNILSSMKRMLRGLRKTTTMDFVEGGRAALDAMEVEPYDMVISDMRMPGMDGAELLSQIRTRWPYTLRIMLTGQADNASLLRTVNVVHSFLLKPCEQDEIKECIISGCALHSFLLEGVSEASEEQEPFCIDPLPQVCHDVQDTLFADDCTVGKLEDCLKRDDWLSSHLIMLCQSLDTTSEHAITSIADVVHEVGYEALHPLLLSLYLFQKLIAQRPEDESFTRVLLHGMRVAWLARRIALVENAGGATIVNALIGGLLHDIGYLILANRDTEQYTKVFNDLQNNGDVFDVCERDFFTFSHNKAGALLLVRLGFPLTIIEIVAYHSQLDVSLSTFFDGLTAVHVADSLSAGSNNSSCCFASSLDKEYLSKVQCLEKVTDWKNI